MTFLVLTCDLDHNFFKRKGHFSSKKTNIHVFIFQMCWNIVVSSCGWKWLTASSVRTVTDSVTKTDPGDIILTMSRLVQTWSVPVRTELHTQSDKRPVHSVCRPRAACYSHHYHLDPTCQSHRRPTSKLLHLQSEPVSEHLDYQVLPVLLAVLTTPSPAPIKTHLPAPHSQ